MDPLPATPEPIEQPIEDENKITGTLDSVRFHEDSYLIGRLRLSKGGSIVPIKGSCHTPQIGATYHLEGSWSTHPRFGKTFAFQTYTVDLPTDPASIITYLTSTARWIGAHIGMALVDRYGGETLQILKTDPERVAEEIRGITITRALEIQERLVENERIEATTIQLHDLFTGAQLGKSVVRKCLDLWQHLAVEILRADPFRLTEIHGCGFLSADRIRAKLGVAPDAPSRIRAGVLHVLSEAASGDGHTFLRDYEFKRTAMEVLSLPDILIEAHLPALQDAGDIRLTLVEFLGVEGYEIGLRRLHDAELRIANHIRSMRESYTPPTDPHPLDLSGLADDQIEALQRMQQANPFIVTGAPGTGKTTAVKAMLRGLPPGRVACAAPTGKAAQRMYESTGFRASTIHRLLGAMMTSDGFVFAHNRDNPLPYETVILDEVSMVDVPLMASFVEALPLTSRLILIGDTNQLPSVGPGNVLRDLIASGVIDTVELRTIKRQDAGNIVRACHQIRDGQDVYIDNHTSIDLFIQSENDEQACADAVVDLVTNRLPGFREGYSPIRDIQVLTPLRERGELSCKALNVRLQKALNPNLPPPNLRFAVGDKIIQLSNDYGLNVFNGEIGLIRDIDTAARTYHLDFENPERHVVVKWSEADIDLAYVVTVHKSQGSEWPVVVIPCHKSQRAPILSKNLIYTAISRAKEVCVIAGQQSQLNKIIKSKAKMARNTRLETFLRTGEGRG